jgi:hypothetical protein
MTCLVKVTSMIMFDSSCVNNGFAAVIYKSSYTGTLTYMTDVQLAG